MEDAYQKYLRDRHEAHVTGRHSLDDFALKTSERYGQWVLIISGGALAISITFLGKIAPHPASNTLFLLGLSWLAYIFAILAGFSAIFVRREAIYRQIEIDDESYEQFRKTTKEDVPEGELLPKRENRHINMLNW